MKLRFFAINIIVILLIISNGVLGTSPQAVKGVLDLTGLGSHEAFMVKLNGEWEFFWNKMLLPGDFSSNSFKPDYFGDVPSYWTDYSGEPVKTERFGYATYRLTVLLPQGMKSPLALDVPVFDSSYDLFLNGKYLGGNGTPGKSAKETKPEYRRNFFRFIPDSDTLKILIHVSNFDHRRGGFWLPMKLGTFREVQRQLANSWAAEWSVITILLGFSLFFLFFYILSPKDTMMAFLSIMTIGLALRPLFTSHFLILNLFNMEWIWIVRSEYIGLYMIIIGCSWFSFKAYPSLFIHLLTWFITAFFTLAVLATVFLPARIFTFITYIYYPSILLLIGYLIYKSITGALKGNSIDIMYLMAFFLLFLGGIHDIRVASGRADYSADYLLPYLIVIFVFIQAALLLFKWVKSFNEKEKLQLELEYMNRNLEILVSERTQELKTRNEEIEKQNSRIALQNKQLSDTINLKNRIFSLIAHDLRSPVVNILYMLNLLKEKEYKEKYDEFANSSIQYAQMVISLLENMLVWGRGQEDKIKFSPEKRDLADIILTNLSIFKESADNKEISVNFTQVGSSVAYFDKDLLDIIIRNLLSNAVKYTPRGGRISILLKDKSHEKEGVLFKICDNGIGFSETKKKYIFTSTEIESTPGTEKEKGTGLGLKLCHDLVKINNGTISVESNEGEGACFIITLPSQGPTAPYGRE